MNDLTPDKGRYVRFEGSRREKRELRQALKYPPHPIRSGGASHWERQKHDRRHHPPPTLGHALPL